MESTKLLKSLTGKKNIFYTDRGNTSILLALKLAKSLGKTKAFIQDQGGWLTYEPYLRKLKFEYHLLDTDYGLLRLSTLESNIDSSSLLLTNSMPGYYALQENMGEIAKLCRKNSTMLVNDSSGSIGTEAAKHGDVVLGSFGRWKPLNIEYGGFLSFDGDHTAYFTSIFTKKLREFDKELADKLKSLPERLKRLHGQVAHVKSQLADFDIFHKESEGLNVIARYRNDDEKLRLVDFCKLFGYEYTLCPRYIRINEEAVSIETKRSL